MTLASRSFRPSGVYLNHTAAVARPFGYMADEARDLLDYLLGERWITEFEHASVLEGAHLHNRHVIDLLIEREILEEGMLMSVMANRYKTQFVSLSQLSRTQVASSILCLIPRADARAYGLVPLRYSASADVLYVLAARASDRYALEKVLAKLTGIRTVRLVIARPAAVQAAFELHYERAPGAMMKLLRRARWTKPLVDDRPSDIEALSEMYEPQYAQAASE